MNIQSFAQQTLDDLDAIVIVVGENSSIQNTLSKRGIKSVHQCKQLNHTETAINTLKPDLVIINYVASESPLKTISQLCHQFEQLDFIVCSSELSENDKQALYQAGVRDILSNNSSESDVFYKALNLIKSRSLTNFLSKEYEINQKEYQEIAHKYQLAKTRIARIEDDFNCRIKHRTTDLIEANRELKRLNRNKAELLTAVSAEVRTPLSTIQSFAELLRDGKNIDDGMRSNFLSIIEKQSDRVSKLVDHVLELQAIDSGRMIWKRRNIDIVPLSNTVVDQFTPLFEHKGLSLNLTSEFSKVHINGEEGKYRQVLRSILSNALDFTDQGGVEINIQPCTRWCNVLLITQDKELRANMALFFHDRDVNTVSLESIDKLYGYLKTNADSTDLIIFDENVDRRESKTGVKDLRERYPYLSLIFINSLQNSAQFSRDEPDGPHLDRTFMKDSENHEEIESIIESIIKNPLNSKMVKISVRDTGIGIAPEHISKVYSRFYQIENDRNEQCRGAGLGLSLCKEIIEHYQGKTWIESTLGKGTETNIVLPITKPNSKKLGEILLERGLLTESQLNDALNDQY